MSTIYLNQHGTEITKDGGKIVITTRDGKRSRYRQVMQTAS